MNKPPRPGRVDTPGAARSNHLEFPSSIRFRRTNPGSDGHGHPGRQGRHRDRRQPRHRRGDRPPVRRAKAPRWPWPPGPRKPAPRRSPAPSPRPSSRSARPAARPPPIRADLSKPEDRERLVTEANEQLGPADILVSNAAVTYFTPVTDFTARRFQLMFDVQVEGPFHLAQLVVPAMREKGRGWILNISSIAARHPAMPAHRLGPPRRDRLRHVQGGPGTVLHRPGRRTLRRRHRGRTRSRPPRWSPLPARSSTT